jgi:hypothetical protein
LDIHRALDEPREPGAIGRTVRYLLGIVVLAVFLQTLLAVLLPNGVGILDAALERELAWVHQRNPVASNKLSQWMEIADDWLFRRSGVEQFTSRSHGPVSKPLTNIFRRVFHGIVACVQLLTLRLGSLMLTLPLLGVLLVIAAVEGWANWYLRRLSGARETSFLYHRFKKAAKFALPALLIVYLIPPVPLDLAWVAPPFFVLAVIGLGTAVALFKKHL